VSVIFLVLPLALLVVLAAVAAFAWAARRGQFDDLETPAIRMLHDDEDVARRDEAPRTGPDSRVPGPAARGCQTGEYPIDSPGEPRGGGAARTDGEESHEDPDR
jgi:cbb3-type cytochrome oxidase maturation protein